MRPGRRLRFWGVVRVMSPYQRSRSPYRTRTKDFISHLQCSIFRKGRGSQRSVIQDCLKRSQGSMGGEWRAIKAEVKPIEQQHHRRRQDPRRTSGVRVSVWSSRQPRIDYNFIGHSCFWAKQGTRPRSSGAELHRDRGSKAFGPAEEVKATDSPVVNRLVDRQPNVEFPINTLASD